MKPSARFVFLGGRPLGLPCLEALEAVGLVPEIIIANPDRPAGRGQVLTAPPEKEWAQKRGIEVLQPQKLKEVTPLLESRGPWDVFVLAAYSQILSKSFLAIPKHGVVNMHPSYLPYMRGPSPIRSSILHDHKDAVGVSVMLIDDKMDHGPIIAQKHVEPPTWPVRGGELDALLIAEGSTLLAQTLPQYLAGTLSPIEQSHEAATYCHFFEKEDALIDLSQDAYQNLLKICAYDGWPGAYTFVERNGVRTRVKIVSAHNEHNQLILDRVVPEGKKEIDFATFMRS